MGVGEGTAVTEKETEVLSHTVKVKRMQKVYDMMREGEWKEVCQEFQIHPIMGIFQRFVKSSRGRISIERHFFSGFDLHRLIDLYFSNQYKSQYSGVP